LISHKRLMIIPYSIKSNKTGFEFFANLANAFLTNEVDPEKIDLTNISFLEAEKSAILAAILDMHYGKSSINLLFRPKVEEILQKNGFYKMFNLGNSIYDIHGSTIPLQKLGIDDHRLLQLK